MLQWQLHWGSDEVLKHFYTRTRIKENNFQKMSIKILTESLTKTFSFLCAKLTVPYMKK